jgi:hypothetical protein
MPPTLFCFVIFQVGSHSDYDPLTYCLPHNWDHRCVPPQPAYWLRRGLNNFLSGLVLNFGLPNLSLPSSLDYLCHHFEAGFIFILVQFINFLFYAPCFCILTKKSLSTSRL